VNRVLSYQTFSFGPASTPIGHIIQHVVNHGTHHRGQVVTMLRQLGATPPKGMDLVLYYRDKAQA
jgi:uncharacterized damage-inducible protein DinB